MYALAKNPENTARSELAGIMSDLLKIKLSNTELELVTDVLIGILRQAERELRRAVAERLSVMEEIPLRMVLSLANDEIEVADPVLRRSRVLSDIDLIYIVKSQGVEHGRSIATRPNLSEPLINILLENKDIPTAISLTENKAITFDDITLEKFVEMAKTSAELAKPLVLREELSKDMLELVYSFVGDDIKEHLASEAEDTAKESVLQVVDSVVEGLSRNMDGDLTPSRHLMAHAELLLEKESLTPSLMIENLRRGQMAEFIAMFSVYCSLPKSITLQILKQNHGQGLAVACKAEKLQKADFVNIYLMTARLRDNTIVKQSDLARALSYFDKIRASDARAILNQSRH
jgi:uncharacterized protein (DUF2336 family)